MSHVVLRLAGGLALVAFSAGCQAVPRQSVSLETTRLDISSRELRVRTYAFGRLLALRIEETADSVIRATRDPLVRRRALVWKAAAIPALQEAVLAPDPLVAAVDLYAYCLQTRDYFETGDGARLFGPEQAIVRARTAPLVASAQAFAQQVAGERKAPLQYPRLEAWVREHPIRGEGFDRESIVGEVAQVFGGESGSAFATLGRLDESVGEMAERLQFMNETGLKQARWTGQLLAGDLVRPQDLDDIRTLLHGTRGLVDTLPDLVSGERAAVLEGLSGQVRFTLRDIDRQRVATLEALRAEREAAFRDFAAVHNEQLTQERIAVLVGVDSILARTIERSRSLIDYTIWRLTELALGLTLLYGLFLLAAVAVWRRTSTGVRS